VLISADQVDLALLGTLRPVHVVVPPVRADEVVACVRDVLASLPDRVISLPDVAHGPQPTDLRRRGPGWAARAGERLSRVPSAEQPGPVGPSPWTGPPAPDQVARVEDWRALASRLVAGVGHVASVGATAQALADDIARTGSADAAVLVQSATGDWEVAGGVGLRSFEWGQVVDERHWLVGAGRDRGPALLIADTDLVRNQLVGAPLASRRQLVRTHAHTTRLMAVAGWSTDAMGPERVALVTAAVARHEAAVADAIELRYLVQALAQRVEGVDRLLR
jgi:hypothetical protein